MQHFHINFLDKFQGTKVRLHLPLYDVDSTSNQVDNRSIEPIKKGMMQATAFFAIDNWLHDSTFKNFHTVARLLDDYFTRLDMLPLTVVNIGE